MWAISRRHFYFTQFVHLSLIILDERHKLIAVLSWRMLYVPYQKGNTEAGRSMVFYPEERDL